MTEADSTQIHHVAGVLLHQLYYNHGALHLNLSGLGEDDALFRPEPAGNCINWIVGHLVVSRNLTLAAIGEEAVIEPARAAVYQRGADPLGPASTHLPLAELLTAFDAAQETLVDRLPRFDSEELEAESPVQSPGRSGDDVATTLAGLIFHEAYHVGQTGLLRRLLGQDGALG